MTCVYRIEGAVVHAQPCAAGPWSRQMQHGGAPASLIAWAAERIETRAPMHVVRITMDLLRPVPIAAIEIRTSVVREGRKIQVCTVDLLHGGVEVVRASVLKIRMHDAVAAAHETPAEEPISLPGPEHGQTTDGPLGREGDAFIDGFEMRTVRGGFRQPGPAAIWFRTRRPIIEGEPITPLMRAAMTADFSNGVGSVLDYRRWTFINADLSINLARMPVGDWILLDAQTWLGAGGAGIAAARLGDERGYFGRAVQSLVIERRDEERN